MPVPTIRICCLEPLAKSFCLLNFLQFVIVSQFFLFILEKGQWEKSGLPALNKINCDFIMFWPYLCCSLFISGTQICPDCWFCSFTASNWSFANVAQGFFQSILAVVLYQSSSNFLSHLVPFKLLASQVTQVRISFFPLNISPSAFVVSVRCQKQEIQTI